MKTLVLAEKPSVGRELARILKANQKENGALVGTNYVVTWALGHLVTLASPEDYQKEWKNWDLLTLPMLPERFKTRIIPSTSKQYGIVKKWMTNPQVSEIIIATDAGREGELVARWIIKEASVNKPMKRLWISSMTEQAIRHGFQNLKPANQYLPLYYSAEARSIADWLIGLNATRALTCKYNAQLSAGRVQTPTLAMIVKREEEIRSFKARAYYQLNLKYKGITFSYLNPKNETIWDEAKAKILLNDLKKQNYYVKALDGRIKIEQPPLLYDLTELQRDANRIYGMGAKHTLDIIQQLYENHKVLTYPRTDSRYLSDDLFDSINERLKALRKTKYSNIVNQLLMKKLAKQKRIFNNQAVSDHHAVIPTELMANFHAFSQDEERIYDLVVKRFISVFLDDAKYQQTIITLAGAKHEFQARGKTPLELGWRIINQKNINDEDEEEDQVLPKFSINEKIINPLIDISVKKTNPPLRYTEASLLTAMENAGKFVENKQLKETLTRVSGIGTPATRAEIIERLFSVGYMELKGKSIYPTIKGEQLIELVPSELSTPALTANWEMKLDEISKGILSQKQFIKDMEANAKELVNNIKNQDKVYHHPNQVMATCPTCGQRLLQISNQKGEILVCSDRNCNYRKNVSLKSNLRCPTCHKKLTIIGSDDKKFYVCTCGYKIKTDRFHEKLKEKKQSMDKRQIQTYLKKQDVPSNNPFAELFNKEKK